jgi:hypothetical protein
VIDPSGPFAAVPALALASIAILPGVLLWIRRWDPMGWCIGFLGASVATSIAALAAVVAGTATRPWFLVMAIFLYAAGLFRLLREGPLRGADPLGDRWALLGWLIIGATTLVYLYRAPVHYDPRSIWFFHASWFTSPDVAYVDLLPLPFPHPDYPPLVPSFSAFTWLFGNDRNDWIAQTTTGLLTLVAIGGLVVLLTRGIRSPGLRAVAGGLATLAVLGVIQEYGFDGHADGITAVAVATLCLVAILGDDPPLGAVAAVAAVLAKSEGAVFVLVVILPLYLLLRRSLRPLIPALVLGAGWVAAVTVAGSRGEEWHLSAIFPWSDRFLERLGAIAGSLTGNGVFIAAAVLWLGAVLVSWGRRERGLSQVLIAGGAGLALLLSIVVFYLASSRDLQWHLDTSAHRLVLHPSLVLVVGAGLGFVAVLRSLSHRPETEPSPDSKPARFSP